MERNSEFLLIDLAQIHGSLGFSRRVVKEAMLYSVLACFAQLGVITEV